VSATASRRPVFDGRFGSSRSVLGSGPQQHRGSFRVGRIAGIDILFHFTLPLFLGWMALREFSEGHDWQAAVAGLVVTTCVFGFIVAHELGHALVAREFEIRTFDITLLPIGGVGHLERIPERPWQELLIAIAGPSVNIVLALVLWGVGALMKATSATLHVLGAFLVAKLLLINIGLAVFNLLPAFPMDGGRVLRAALAIRIGRSRATAIAARIGKVVAIGFGVVGLFSNPMLLFIALFVWFGATQENDVVQRSSP
jgi:stage IV sporulation protein FB